MAGIFTPLLVEVLELALSIDDPTGAITVHGAAGLWGLSPRDSSRRSRASFLLSWSASPRCSASCSRSSICFFALLNRVVPFRVDPDGERMGMDLHELGGGAYPEFVIHRDESYR